MPLPDFLGDEVLDLNNKRHQSLIRQLMVLLRYELERRRRIERGGKRGERRNATTRQRHVKIKTGAW